MDISWFSFLRIVEVSSISFGRDSKGEIVLHSSDDYAFSVWQGITLSMFALPMLGYILVRATVVNDLQWWVNASFCIFPLFIVTALCTDRCWMICLREMTVRAHYRIFGHFVFWTRESDLENFITAETRAAYSDKGKKHINIRDLFLVGPNKKWFLLRCRCDCSWEESLERLNQELCHCLTEKQSEISKNRCTTHFLPSKVIQTVEKIGLVLFFIPFLLTLLDIALHEVEFQKYWLIGIALGGFSLLAISKQALLGRVLDSGESECSRDDTKR